MLLRINTVLILLINCCLHSDVTAQLEWNNHVYTGRHFDDYMTATKYGPPNVIRPTLLILYNPTCEKNLTSLKESMLPPDKYLVLAKHDYTSFPSWIWYQFDERDNLTERYKPVVSCPQYLFFQNGSTVHNPDRYIESLENNVLSWIWERLTVNFTIVNNRKEPIVVHFDTVSFKEQQKFVVEPGQSKLVTSYVSNVIYISSGTDFVLVRIVELDFAKELVITQEDHVEGNMLDVIRQTKRSMLHESLDTRRWREIIANLYLLNFKQPVLLPLFTDKGYKKGKIPEDLYKEIFSFYLENLKNRQREENEVEPAINDREVKCTMVYLSPEMIDRISEAMLPIMEDWCNCNLVQTRLYGVREYYTHNILRNHIDRISTHIISVILQIDKDLDGAEDWPLEIIDMTGRRQQVYLEPGEMLFYESATLIHGRPSPFQGRLFANAFLHYKPRDNWPWDISHDSRYLMESGENVEPTMMMKPISRPRKTFHTREEL